MNSFLSVITAILISNADARTDCHARQSLNEISTNYQQLESPNRSRQQDAARRLEQLLPVENVGVLALQLSSEGRPVDPSDLSEALTRAYIDAQLVLSGHDVPPQLAQHRAVLASEAPDLSCLGALHDIPAGQAMVQAMGASGSMTMSDGASQVEQPPAQQGRLLAFAPLVGLTQPSLILLAIALFVTSIVTASRVYIFQVARRSKRQKRRTLAMKLRVSVLGADRADQIDATSVDISMGGMKVALGGSDGSALGPGQSVIVHLAGRDVPATVVWSNQFYFGVAFVQPLSGKSFRAIIDET